MSEKLSFVPLDKQQKSQCTLTWQTMSLLEKRTIIRYLGVLYLFLSCITRRLRAKKSVFPSGRNTHLYHLKWHLKYQTRGGRRLEQGLTSPPPEFDLIPLEVGLVLHHFNKTLQKNKTGTDLRIKGETFDIAKTSSTLLYCVSSWTVSVTG